MNAYFCDAGDRRLCEEMIAGYPRYEMGRVFGLAVAETRGRAKAMLAAKADVPFIEIRTRLVEFEVDERPGLMPEGHRLWESVDWCCLEEQASDAVQP